MHSVLFAGVSGLMHAEVQGFVFETLNVKDDSVV